MKWVSTAQKIKFPIKDFFSKYDQIALEILYALTKSPKFIKGIEIFDHRFLFTAYADDSTYFFGTAT